MPVYSIDVKVYATAYIRARSPAQALVVANGLHGNELTLAEDELVSSLRLDDPNLPLLSLSPVLTVHGPDADAVPERC